MNQSHDEKIYDVIISGAGPVGLFLACELALAKCRVLILEKAARADSPLKVFPFGIRGLSAPSIEALDRRGLLDKLELHRRLQSPHAGQAKAPPGQRQVGHFAGIPFVDGNVDTSKWPYRLPSSLPTHLLSEMAELERALTERAEILGVEIRHGHPITSLQATENAVTVFSDEQTFKARWLVGGDGARSVVRKMMGFDFVGTEPAFTGYTLMLDLADPQTLRPGRNITAHGMYLQSQPGYIALQDFDGGKFHASGASVTREHAEETLRRISETEVSVTAVHAATTWTDRARQTTEYRKGRVLLAGDAAHIHSPLGGQGLNLGLGDAMNLGWKLAAEIHGTAPAGLLDTYYSERHPVGAQVLEWSRAQVTLMHSDAGARSLHAVVRDLLNTRDGATYVAERIWGLSLRYGLGGDHALVGASVPNFEFTDGTRTNELLRNGQGLLLNLSGTSALDELARAWAPSVRYASGPVKENFGLSALLVRPDGIVVCVSDDKISRDQYEAELQRWFRAKA